MENKELIEKCQRVLSYDDRLNLEHEIERQYKIKQGYDKMGLNWAFTDQDRRNIRYEKEEAVEWVLLLEAIPIIQKAERERIREQGAAIHLESIGGKPVIMFDDGDFFEQTGELISVLMHLGIVMPRCELPDDMVIIPAQAFKGETD